MPPTLRSEHDEHGRMYPTAYIEYPHSELAFVPEDVHGRIANRYETFINGHDMQVKHHVYYAPPRLDPNDIRVNLFISARVSIGARDAAFESFSKYDDGLLYQAHAGQVHLTIANVGINSTWWKADRALRSMLKPASFLCRLAEPRVIPNARCGQYAVFRVVDAGITGNGDVPVDGDRVVAFIDAVYSKLHEAGIKVAERRPQYPHVTVAKYRRNRIASPPDGLPAWIVGEAAFQSPVFEFVEFRLSQSVYSPTLGDHCLMPLQLYQLPMSEAVTGVPTNNPPNSQWYGT